MLPVFRRLVRVPLSRRRDPGFPAARSASSLVGSIQDKLSKTKSDRRSEEMLGALRDFSGEPPLANPAGDSGLRVIPLSDDSLSPAGVYFGPASAGGIFVRPCYEDLYDTLVLHARSRRNALLLGNPGIGKSFAQAYLMWRLVQDAVAAEAGSVEAETRPPFFYRQIGDRADAFMYDDLDNPRVCNPGMGAEALFSSIATLARDDEEETGNPLRPRPWAVFEPAGSRAEPPWCYNDGQSMFMVLSALPDNVRYKQFLENGADRFFMPPWELDELLDAAHWTRSQPAWEHVPKDLADLWHPDKIKESYEIFGGIIRYVLPTWVDTPARAKGERNSDLEDVARNYDVAMRNANDVHDGCSKARARRLLQGGPVRPQDLQSHYFLQLDPVREGPANTIVWGQLSVKMLRSVADEVRVRADRAELHHVIESLKQTRIHGYNPSIPPGYESEQYLALMDGNNPSLPRGFEQYVKLALTHDDQALSDRILATWMVARADGSGFDHLAKPRASRTAEHPTKARVGNVCLRSKDNIFPAVDVQWIRDSKTLCAINVTMSTSVRSHSCPAVLDFLENFMANEFRQDEDKSIKLCFFVPASQASNYNKRLQESAFTGTDSEADRLVKCASWFRSSSKANLAQNEDFAHYVKVFKARLADWRAGTGALEILQDDARDADPRKSSETSNDELKALKQLAAVTSLASLGILELQVWHSPEDLTPPDQ